MSKKSGTQISKARLGNVSGVPSQCVEYMRYLSRQHVNSQVDMRLGYGLPSFYFISQFTGPPHSLTCAPSISSISQMDWGANSEQDLTSISTYCLLLDLPPKCINFLSCCSYHFSSLVKVTIMFLWAPKEHHCELHCIPVTALQSDKLQIGLQRVNKIVTVSWSLLVTWLCS